MARSRQTPQRFTPRSSSALPGRVRRSLDGASQSGQRNGDTIEVAADGRLESRLVRNGGLELTRQGLKVNAESVGEKNRPQLSALRELDAAASAATVAAKVNELMAELRRTGHMKVLPK